MEISQWVLENLNGLARISYNALGQKLIQNAPIRFVSFAEVDGANVTDHILIPTDISGEEHSLTYRKVLVGEANIHICQPIDKPEGVSWNAIPNEDATVWWQSPKGNLIPAWNFYRTIVDLLLFKEEQQVTIRDTHNRFPISASKRFTANLTHVPIVNDTLALLLDAAASIQKPDHALLSGIEDYVLPPAFVLSHDCDNLTGNTFWTQVARLVRFLKLIGKGKPSAFKQLKYFAQNFMNGRRYYFSDQIDMWRLQQKHGFSSVIYILNGKGGRFGARTPFDLSRELIETAPEKTEVGAHYNYGYVKKPEDLQQQISQIQNATKGNITSGRAHYLYFDPLTDFPSLIRNGILLDESVGWPYRNSYRAGIAGPFIPYNSKEATSYEVLELPMTFMDGDLHREDGGVDTFSAMLDHIKQVGGCLSILVHPGANMNPERSEMKNVYSRVLKQLDECNARSFTPRQLLSLWKGESLG